MSSTRLTRRRPTALRAPFFPMSLFPADGFDSLGRAAADLSMRADEMMRSTFPDFPELMSDRFPAMNLSESKDEFTITAELPGMQEKDVTVEYCDGVLTIRGEKEREEKKEEDERKYFLWERTFGSFQRSLPFPGGIAEDKISAGFKNGVLTVHVPKAEEASSSTRTIPVTPG